jgi:large subunit ribosomal protein L10
MSTIREGKAAVVDAVREKLDGSDAAVVTEYRGLTVGEMASLRRALRAAGGDYKVFKNTLVRRAVEGSGHEAMTGLLEGPTAIAFVHGDVSAVAKALRDFARTAPALIVKGGVLDGALLDARELAALADLPSREVLLSMFAGALAAPMRSMANLLQALPQNFAYGLSALLEQRGGASAEPAAQDTASEPPAETTPEAEADGPAPAAETAAPEAAASGEATESANADGEAPEGGAEGQASEGQAADEPAAAEATDEAATDA